MDLVIVLTTVIFFLISNPVLWDFIFCTSTSAAKFYDFLMCTFDSPTHSSELLQNNDQKFEANVAEVIFFFWVFVFTLVVLDQCSYGGLLIMFMNVCSVIWMEMHILLIKQNMLLSARSGQFLWVVNIFCDGWYIHPLFLRVDLFFSENAGMLAGTYVYSLYRSFPRTEFLRPCHP